MTERTGNTSSKSNSRIGLMLGGLVACMIGLSFAAVPLYQIFCQVTGFGGTPQVVEAGQVQIVDRQVTVRFNADIDRSLDWQFKPAQLSVNLKLGEQTLAFYKASNTTDQILVGSATFNVTPEKAGQYFNKIECFCFTEQTLEPGQTVDMPVSFYVDPRLNDDPSMADVTTITLSYTFYRVKQEDAAPHTTAQLTTPLSSRN
ncbi:MAG: cytochrome c oxidase assembly protein [Alphaproteobacteria bacterium]|jgi:cytochrome c oxidase assembly protein subunit 11